ncbi:MAG: YqzL-like protein [Clostridia bacterium]|nr:YqzL-like protein [Clostridia bacterium]
MEISEAWWHLFTLTGNIEAYLLYRGVYPGDSPAVATLQLVAGGADQGEGSQ